VVQKGAGTRPERLALPSRGRGTTQRKSPRTGKGCEGLKVNRVCAPVAHVYTTGRSAAQPPFYGEITLSTTCFITGRNRASTLTSATDQSRTYPTGQFADIITMCRAQDAAAPEHTPKDSWWAVFVDNNHAQARRKQWQQANEGSNTCLWTDVDEGDPSFAQVKAFAHEFAGGAEYLIYTSRSHGEPRPDGTIKQKYRVIFPHDSRNVWPMTFKALQMAMMEVALAHGIKADPATLVFTQLCYLPNRGPMWQWHHEPGPLLNIASAAWLPRALDIAATLQSDAVATFEAKAGEGSRSIMAAFHRKHTASDMLQLYGFETNNGVDWHHPSQSTNSFGTKADDDDRGWVTASQTVAALLGRANGDAFDIFAAFSATREGAEAYARLCLQAEEDARYGAATAAHGATVRLPVAAVATVDYALQAQVAAEVAAERAALQVDPIEDYNEFDRTGAWLKELPPILCDVKNNPMEWLAWNAPGVVGELVRFYAPSASRATLVPTLGGVLAAVQRISMGHFVSFWNGHTTTPALCCYLVGPTSSGKSDVDNVMDAIIDEVYAASEFGPKPQTSKRRGFTSAAALALHLGGNDKTPPRPNCILVDDESGIRMKSSENDSHAMGFIGSFMEIFTKFRSGVAGDTSAGDGDRRDIHNPCLARMSTSTAVTLFPAMKAMSAESGYPGRFLYLETTLSRTLDQRVGGVDRRPAMPAHLSAYLKALASVKIPKPHEVENDDRFWVSSAQNVFHVRSYDEAAAQAMHAIRVANDNAVESEGIDDKLRSMTGRLLELVNRLAVVVGTGPTIGIECVSWANALANHGLQYAVKEMDIHQIQISSGDAGRVQVQILRTFELAKNDKRFFNSMLARRHPTTHAVEIKLNILRRKLKENTRAGSTIIAAEIEGFKSDNTLLVANRIMDKAATEWLTLG